MLVKHARAKYETRKTSASCKKWRKWGEDDKTNRSHRIMRKEKERKTRKPASGEKIQKKSAERERINPFFL